MHFKPVLFFAFTVLISCGEKAQPVSNSPSATNYKSDQQKQFLSRYNTYLDLFNNSVTEQERRSIEQQYNEWFDRYVKDTLQHFNNWAGRITDIDGNANVTDFTITGLESDISFTGLVTITTPAFDSLAKMKEGDYVIFTARLDAIKPPWPKADKSLNTFSVYLFLDAITNCPAQQE